MPCDAKVQGYLLAVLAERLPCKLVPSVTVYIRDARVRQKRCRVALDSAADSLGRQGHGHAEAWTARGCRCLVLRTSVATVDELVWYVSYGSNMCLARFRLYLEGGSLPGMTRQYPQCDAGTEIRAVRTVDMKHRLFFALPPGKTEQWGESGRAFVDTAPRDSEVTYGRAYLVTIRQLICVAWQENSGKGKRPEIRASMLESGVYEIRPQGWYRLLVVLPAIGEHPAVTLTGPASEKSEPSPEYLGLIRTGILESRPDLTSIEIDNYLKTAVARN